MNDKEYFIVSCWCGGGAMVLAEGELWNSYNGRPGTLFTNRKDAKRAADATRRNRISHIQPAERYRIQKVTL